MATPSRGAADPLIGVEDPFRAPGPPAGRPTPAARAPATVFDRLVDEGYAFDFFQAVRLLQRAEPTRLAVGRGAAPSAEVVRFRALPSLAFPPSAIDAIRPARKDRPAVIIQTFLGLVGPSGVLPRHYTELILRLEREQRGPERRAFRDWLDLFHHRITSLFYRAWEKYRFPLEIEADGGAEGGPFTGTLFSLIGLGTPGLRGRLRVDGPVPVGIEHPKAEPVAAVDDLALLYYGGLLAHRPRSAFGLRAILADYFGMAVEIHQFRGEWLPLEPHDLTRLGEVGANNALGVDAIAGDRVWDIQGKIRITLGPLGFDQFRSFLPDDRPGPGGGAFFLLSQLARLYVGPDLAFEIQPLLRADAVPEARLASPTESGSALGRDAWLRSSPFELDAGDAVFPGAEAPAP